VPGLFRSGFLRYGASASAQASPTGATESASAASSADAGTGPGHDALIAVRPDASGAPDGGAEELRVRVSQGDPPEPGEFVSLTVHGSVAAWAPAGGE
jgi:hypothetical protein